MKVTRKRKTNESSSTYDAPVAELHEWGNTSSLAPTFQPTWGTEPRQDNMEDTSWEDTNKSPPRQTYSPDKNPHRSGSCQYCEVNLGSRKMNGPLTCSECRHLLAYDKRLEEEKQRYQQQREERRPRQRTQESAVPPLVEAVPRVGATGVRNGNGGVTLLCRRYAGVAYTCTWRSAVVSMKAFQNQWCSCVSRVRIPLECCLTGRSRT